MPNFKAVTKNDAEKSGFVYVKNSSNLVVKKIATTCDFQIGINNVPSSLKILGDLEVSGLTVFSQSLRGSLTKLADGTTDYLQAGDNVTITKNSDGSMTISSTGGSGGSDGAPVDATYVVTAANGTLTNEKVLTAGANITITPGESTVTIASTGASAAGSDTQVQFNDGGSALGAEADFVYDKTNNLLNVGKTQIGTWSAGSGYAIFQHKDVPDGNGYALIQTYNGHTYLNCVSGKSIVLRNYNNTIGILDNNTISLTGQDNVVTTTTLGNTYDASSTTIDSGTGAINIATSNSVRDINIGTGTSAQNINIGNGAAANAISIGSNSASTATINGGSTLSLYANAGTITVDSTGGSINVGTFGYAQTISIGNTTGGTSVELLAGTGGITLTGEVSTSGDITVGGNDIKSSTATAISLNGQNVTVAGDLTVSGGKITLTNGSTIDSETINVLKLTESDVRIIGQTLSTDQTTFNLINTTATTLNIGAAASSGLNIGSTIGMTNIRGPLKVSGNNIYSSTGAISLKLQANNVTANNNLTVTNDLTVNGTSTLKGGGAIGVSGIVSTLSVYSNTTFYGDLGIFGPMTFEDTVTFNDSVDFNGSVYYDSLEIGGGYGFTGVTISSVGNIQANGTLTVDGTSTLTGNVTFGGNIIADANEAKSIFTTVTTNTITIGGAGSTVSVDKLTVGGGYGYGLTGVTITTGGSINANGELTVDGSFSAANGFFYVNDGDGYIDIQGIFQAQSVVVGGGYGFTGVTISSDGNIQANGTLTVDGTSTLTGNVTFGGNIIADANEAKSIFTTVTSNTITIGGVGSTVSVDKLTVGGGYGSTGVTIDISGNINANGELTVDGSFSAAGGLLVANSGDDFISIQGDFYVSLDLNVTQDVIAAGVSSNTLNVTGTSTLTGNVTFGGNIIADANEAKSIFTTVTSNTITIGGPLATVSVGNFKAGGGYGSAGTDIDSNGHIKTDGGLIVDGATITLGSSASVRAINIGTNGLSTAVQTVNIGTAATGCSVDINADVGAITLRNAEVGAWVLGSSYAVFKHESAPDAGYAVLQNSSGKTHIGCASGTSVVIRENNVEPDIATFQNSGITLNNDVTANCNLIINSAYDLYATNITSAGDINLDPDGTLYFKSGGDTYGSIYWYSGSGFNPEPKGIISFTGLQGTSGRGTNVRTDMTFGSTVMNECITTIQAGGEAILNGPTVTLGSTASTRTISIGTNGSSTAVQTVRIGSNSSQVHIGNNSAANIGFFGKTPTSQYDGTARGQSTGFTVGTGTTLRYDSTWTGGLGPGFGTATAYSINDIVYALKQYGLLAL